MAGAFPDLVDRKILITGPAGQIAFPLACELAAHNEVWGIARFGKRGQRDAVEAAGVITRAIELADGDFGDLPRDFDYVLHLAVFMESGRDYDRALRVNAEGTGRLMSHCRSARACLVVSTSGVYDLSDDPRHLFAEDAPLGDSRQPYSPTYAISKIAQEAVARFSAREFSLPTTIARMNVSYSGHGGLPAYHLDAIVKGEPIALPLDAKQVPPIFHPIHQDDIHAQVPKLLGVASVPATILNWAGDEAVDPITWCEHLGTLVGRRPRFSYGDVAIPGRGVDNTRRIAAIGRCEVPWREGMERMARERHPALFEA